MGLLLRAVVTGFGLALGASVFKKHVEGRLGLKEDPKPTPEPERRKSSTDEAVDGGGGDSLDNAVS